MNCCSKRKGGKSMGAGLEGGECEGQESRTTFLESANPNAGYDDPRSKERILMQAIKDGNYDEIESRITPRAFKYCESNALLMGMKVSFELRKLADNKGPDEERFNELANAVEEFTSCLLDPLRADQRRREEFGDALDDILDDAIRLKQKKFFTHPVVDIEMRRKWYGRAFMKSGWKRWRPVFSVWCLVDLVLSPVLFVLCWLICNHRERKRNEEKRRGKINKDIALEEVNTGEEETLRPQKKKATNRLPVTQIYPISLDTPYFKFLRDSLSFVVLLGLHFALCLAPSSIPFSGLEWAILVFFIGRYLVEREQISEVIHRMKRQRNSGDDGNQSNIVLKAFSMYQRDLWNRLDFVTLLVYLVIFSLRIATFIMSGSVANNRVLVIAGYLYSFNTLCLTFRVFGHVMEQSKDVGTIQIALFSILKDIRTIIWQFTAALFAFSIAITKVYMAENSYVANASDRNDLVCKDSGIVCWWKMLTYMGWTLLGVSDGFDPMKSVDLPSVILAQVLLAFFLIMGVILLINMLIALLSNTYQRIEDNSLKEWSFKRAATIQTYDEYDPIPVPLNIIYNIFKLCKLVGKKDRVKGIMLEFIAIDLDREYFKKYGNFLPPTAEERNNIVFRETVGNRQMVGQILRSAYMPQGVDKGILLSGPEAWEAHFGIKIEGSLLTCTSTEQCTKCSRRQRSQRWPGARYCKPFSFEFPHFETVILESGQQISLGIGVVNEGYDTCRMPGWLNGSVAYHTDGNLYDAATCDNGTETKGPAVAFRGDRILCTVMFEKKCKRNGKLQVPVLFTLNGRKIIISEEEEPEIYIDWDTDKPLYPYVSMNYGSSVVAKMCPRESEEFKVSKMAELDRKVTQIEAILEENNRKLDTLLARLAKPVIGTQH